MRCRRLHACNPTQNAGSESLPPDLASHERVNKLEDLMGIEPKVRRSTPGLPCLQDCVRFEPKGRCSATAHFAPTLQAETELLCAI